MYRSENGRDCYSDASKAHDINRTQITCTMFHAMTAHAQRHFHDSFFFAMEEAQEEADMEGAHSRTKLVCLSML